jgi:hypothetical protein
MFNQTPAIPYRILAAPRVVGRRLLLRYDAVLLPISAPFIVQIPYKSKSHTLITSRDINFMRQNVVFAWKLVACAFAAALL